MKKSKGKGPAQRTAATCVKTVASKYNLSGDPKPLKAQQIPALSGLDFVGATPTAFQFKANLVLVYTKPAGEIAGYVILWTSRQAAVERCFRDWLRRHAQQERKVGGITYAQSQATVALPAYGKRFPSTNLTVQFFQTGSWHYAVVPSQNIAM